MEEHWLLRYGITDEFTGERPEGLELARVCAQHQTIYHVGCQSGVVTASVSGRFAHEASDNTAFPTVGDVVLIAARSGDGPAVIRRVLPRKSAFVRKAAGTSGTSQIIAANIDTVLICMSLNRDYNLRRLERYVTTVWSSGAVPVVVLTKADLCHDVDAYIKQAEASAPGVDVIAVSTLHHAAQVLQKYILKGKTMAFVGSSGVGKSTLINALMGEEILPTSGLGSDDRGRHTTTSRQMLLLPGGGIVIDTPGMRALEPDGADLASGFADIELLATKCRFRDCSHTNEPGCAVRDALGKGMLNEDRLGNYRKLQREMGYQGLDARAREHAKMENMFGSMSEMKRMFRELKEKRNR